MNYVSLIAPPPVAEARLFASWLNDPEVVRYSEQRHKHHTIGTQTDYWESPATLYPNSVFGIWLANPGKFIGSISATVDLPNDVADVAIMIGDRGEWGKGYGYQAWKLMCDGLFASGIRKIEAGCMHINKGMIRVCEKYGMKLEGKRYDHFQISNGFSDMLLYGKFK